MGRLVDLHGSRRLFLIGVTGFILASAACAMVPGTGSLSAARVVRAVGSAILTPAALALILGACPPGKRTAIVGMWRAFGLSAMTKVNAMGKPSTRPFLQAGVRGNGAPQGQAGPAFSPGATSSR